MSEEKLTAKEKARIKTEQAERKVKETVDNVEKSKIGKHIPTSIEKVTLLDVLKTIIFLNGLLTLAVFIVIEALKQNQGVMPKVLTLFCFLLGFVGTFSFILDLYCLYMKWGNGYVYLLITKTVKAVIVIISSVISSFPSWFIKGLAIFIYFSTIFIEALILYYMAIYFKRIESDEYDDNGEEIRREKVEESV